MVKNRSYGDRGTGYTPRIESVPGTKNENEIWTGCKMVQKMWMLRINSKI